MSVSEPDTESILRLYEKTFDEIAKLREFEWRVAASAVVLTGGSLAVLTNERIAPLLSECVIMQIEMRWLIVGGQVAASAFAIWCLLIAHKYLTVQRRIRRDIEEVLGFHEIGRFAANQSLLPKDFFAPKSFRFQVLGLVIPLILIVVVMQVISAIVVLRL